MLDGAQLSLAFRLQRCHECSDLVWSLEDARRDAKTLHRLRIVDIQIGSSTDCFTRLQTLQKHHYDMTFSDINTTFSKFV